MFSARHLHRLLERSLSPRERGDAIALLISILVKCARLEQNAGPVQLVIQLLAAIVDRRDIAPHVLAIMQACERAGAEVLKQADQRSLASLEQAISLAAPYDELRALVDYLRAIRQRPPFGVGPEFDDAARPPRGVSTETRNALLHEDWSTLVTLARSDLAACANLNHVPALPYLVGCVALGVRKLSEIEPHRKLDLAHEAVDLVTRYSDDLLALAPAADDRTSRSWASSAGELAITTASLFRILPAGSREFPVAVIALLEKALALTARDADPVRHGTYLHDLAHAFQQLAAHLPPALGFAALEYAASLFRETLVLYREARRHPDHAQLGMESRPAHIDYMNLGQLYRRLANTSTSLDRPDIGPYTSPMYLRLALSALATARDIALETGHRAEAVYCQTLLAELGTQIALACLEHTRASKGTLRRHFHEWLQVLEGPVSSTWDFAKRYAFFALDQAERATRLSLEIADRSLLRASLRAMFDVWRVAEMRHGVSGVRILFDDNWWNMQAFRDEAMLAIEATLAPLVGLDPKAGLGELANELAAYRRYFAGRVHIAAFDRAGGDLDHLVAAAEHFDALRVDGNLIARALSRAYAEWFRVTRDRDRIAVGGLSLAIAATGLRIDVLAHRQSFVIGGLDLEELVVATRASSWIKTNSVAAIAGASPQIDWSGVPAMVPVITGVGRSGARTVEILAVQVPTISWDAWVIHVGSSGEGVLELEIPLAARGEPGEITTLHGEALVLEVRAVPGSANERATLNRQCATDSTRLATRATELTISLRTTPTIVNADVVVLAKTDNPFAGASTAASFSLISPGPSVPSSLMRAHAPLLLFGDDIDARITAHVTSSTYRQIIVVGIPSEPGELERLLAALFDPRRDLHLLADNREIGSACAAVERLLVGIQELCGAPLAAVATSVDEDVEAVPGVQIVEVDRTLASAAAQILLDIAAFRRLPWEDIPTGHRGGPYTYQLLGDHGVIRRRLTALPNPVTWDQLTEKYVKLTNDLGWRISGTTDDEAIRRGMELLCRPIAKRPCLVVPSQRDRIILTCVPYARHLGAFLLPDTPEARRFIAASEAADVYVVDGCDTTAYQRAVKALPGDDAELALQFCEMASRDHAARVDALIEGRSADDVSARLFSQMRPSAYVVVSSISPSERWASAIAASHAATLGCPLLLFDDDELFSPEVRTRAGCLFSGARSSARLARDVIKEEVAAIPAITSEAASRLIGSIIKMNPTHVGIVSNRLTIPLELIGDPPMATRFAFGRLCAPDLTSLALLISASALTEEAQREPKVMAVIADAAEAVAERALPGARLEADYLHSSLSRSSDILVDKIRGADDIARFIEASRRANIIHFSGHGSYDNERPAESALIFRAGKLRAADVPRPLDGYPIVFGNACESGIAYGPDDVGRGWSGLAAAFIEAGAVNYIGSLWPIHDDGSRRLAETFYLLLNQGYSTGEALRVAKLQAFEAGDPTWAAMVLFGCPRSRLRSAVRGSDEPPH